MTSKREIPSTEEAQLPMPSSDFKSLSSSNRTPTLEDKNRLQHLLNLIQPLKLSSNESKEIEQFFLDYMAQDLSHIGFFETNGMHIRDSFRLLDQLSQIILLSGDDKINFVKLIIRNCHLALPNQSVKNFHILVNNCVIPNPKKVIRAFLESPADQAEHLSMALFHLNSTERFAKRYPMSELNFQNQLCEHPKQAGAVFGLFTENKLSYLEEDEMNEIISKNSPRFAHLLNLFIKVKKQLVGYLCLSASSESGNRYLEIEHTLLTLTAMLFNIELIEKISQMLDEIGSRLNKNASAPEKLQAKNKYENFLSKNISYAGDMLQIFKILSKSGVLSIQARRILIVKNAQYVAAILSRVKKLIAQNQIEFVRNHFEEIITQARANVSGWQAVSFGARFFRENSESKFNTSFLAIYQKNIRSLLLDQKNHSPR